MKPYPSYKDSGVEWIGRIPSHWDSLKLGRVLDTIESGKREQGGGNNLEDGILSLGGEHILEDGKLSISNPRFISEEFYDEMNSGQVRNDDLLIVKDGATIGKSTHIERLPLDKISVNEHIYILRGKSIVENRFLFYNSRTRGFVDDIWNTVKTSVIPGLSSGFKNEINIIFPPLPEQNQIVSFLDHKTQKIDELIEKTEQKIPLLKEKRTSLINHCVTKGLNPNVEMKDSGVEWIGEIPSHWEVKRLKYLGKVYSSSVDRHIYKDELQVSVCHYPDVYSNEFINEDIELNKGSCSEVEFERFQLKEGLVILTKDSESPDDIGIPCYVETNLRNVACGYHLSIIEKNKNHINSKFLFRFIQSDIVRCHFEVHSKGITRFSLGKYTIENLFTNLPPLFEQKQIVEYLDEQTQKIDTTIKKETQRIELLKEYRQSLISEVVTGKIDVREEVVV